MLSLARYIGDGIHWVSKVFYYISWLVVAVMLFTTCYDVTMRYLFAMPTAWSVELNAILMVYLSFLGAAEVTRQGRHIKMDVLYNRLTGNTQRRIDIFTAVIVLLFSVVLVWMGWGATYVALKYEMYTAGEFHVPLWLVYVCIPLCSFFMGLEFLLRLINMFGNKGEEDDS